MLAVRVERDDGPGALLEGTGDARPQGRALALVGDLADDAGAGLPGHFGRPVGRAVVDDEDGQVLPRPVDDRRERGASLEGRDDGHDPIGRRWLAHG